MVSEAGRMNQDLPGNYVIGGANRHPEQASLNPHSPQFPSQTLQQV